MASNGLRAISYHDTRKVEVGYKPSHTDETLIGYTACCGALIFIFLKIRSDLIMSIGYQKNKFPLRRAFVIFPIY